MEWANFVAWSVNTQQVCPILVPYLKKKGFPATKGNYILMLEERNSCRNRYLY
jgi:hypothetical protein